VSETMRRLPNLGGIGDFGEKGGGAGGGEVSGGGAKWGARDYLTAETK